MSITASEEHDALLACVRSELTTTLDRALRTVTNVNWNTFCNIAQRNEVIPLIQARLERLGPVPASVSDTIGRKSRIIASWNLRLASELIEILKLFWENGIRAVCYKGPALAVDLYGALSSRHCRDLDLLINRKDVLLAVKLLHQSGYQTASPEQPINGREILLSYKDIVLEHPASGVCVELHWAVCEPQFDPRLHAQELWNRTRVVTMLGAPVVVPAPEDLLFLLSIHGLRHYWNCLKWLCDIDRLVETFPELDWDGALQIAERFDRRRAVLLPLEVVRQLFGTSLPDKIQRIAAKERGLGALTRQVFGNLFTDEGEPLSSEDAPLLLSQPAAEMDISKKLFRVRSKDCVRDRIRLLFELIRDFLQPDKQDIASKPHLARIQAVYWFIQPFRLLQSHGLTFFLRTSAKLVRSVVS